MTRAFRLVSSCRLVFPLAPRAFVTLPSTPNSPAPAVPAAAPEAATPAAPPPAPYSPPVTPVRFPVNWLMAHAAAPIRYRTSKGERCEHPLWWAVTHLFNHQTHHRGQVTTLLSQLGHDPGVTDLIAFLRAPRA